MTNADDDAIKKAKGNPDQKTALAMAHYAKGRLFEELLTTLYREVAADRTRQSFGAPELAPIVQTPLRRPAARASQPAH